METEDIKKMEQAKNTKPNSLIHVPVTPDKGFFKWWCIFLRPFHDLTDREIDVVSCMLKFRHELATQAHISDPAILDELVMNETVRNKILKECSITLQHFYVIMGKLRKNKVIVDNKLNPKLIPNIRETDDGHYRMLLVFEEDI